MKQIFIRKIQGGIRPAHIRYEGSRQAYSLRRNLTDICKDLIFPRRCPVCDDAVDRFGGKICRACAPKLIYLDEPWCVKCGKKLMQDEMLCGDCRRTEHFYVRGRAVYEYRSVSAAVYRFKYGGRQEYGEFFGEELAGRLADFIRAVSPDALIPIPLHPNRQSARGYNQAQILAETVGRITGIPVYENLLLRHKDTAPLKYQNPRERQNNLKNAFIIAENDVQLRVVMLVDDIYTTGATMDEAALAFLEKGVTKCYFLTLACGEGI